VAGVTKDGGEGVPQGGTAHFTVDPDRVVKLRNDIDALTTDIDKYLTSLGNAYQMQPPGADPVSFDTAAMFTGNGERALTALQTFRSTLTAFSSSLNESIKKYATTEGEAERALRDGKA
jgi:PE family protein